jgi:hypothetical protein
MTSRSPRSSKLRALGVVVPVHNEEDLMRDALDAVHEAFRHLGRSKCRRGVVVVLDACDDNSEGMAQRSLDVLRRDGCASTALLRCEFHNVGATRALGCAYLVSAWSDLDADTVWLATTDADSRVPPLWLSSQVLARKRGAQLWTGRVRVDDWAGHSRVTRSKWETMYRDEDYPIHGASMGFSALKYREVGGFPALVTGEDRELCRLLMENGATWHHDSLHEVVTSARRDSRAPRGFAGVLERIDAESEALDHG